VRGLHRFDGRASFTTWSFRVATHACLDVLRRRRRRPDPGLPDIERAHDAGDAGRPELDDTVSDRLDVDAALAGLPVEFRAAVVLRDVCGLDYAEIAEVLEVPPGTVRSRIARGRARLAKQLGNPSGSHERQTPSHE
jgi:RNA polymerase sigma-70 factor (ECF subfamily)